VSPHADAPFESASASHLTPQIERYWSLGRVTRIRRIERGLVNQTFHVHTASGSSYILRLYHAAIPPARIHREHALLDRLAAVGFELAPRLIPPVAPPSWKPAELPHGVQRPMALMTCLPGEDRYTWDGPPRSRGPAQELGAALARYHQAVWGWPAGAKDGAPPKAGAPKAGAKKAGALEVDVLRRLEITLAGEVEAVATLSTLTAGLCRLDRSGWPALTVHGDYHAANVRWTGPRDQGRICGIFDFEYADHNWRIYDLGMAAACLATRWGGGPHEKAGEGRLDRPLLEAFMEGYDNAIGAEPPLIGAPLPSLLSGEIAALPRYLALAHLLTLEWALAEGTGRRLGAATAERYSRHARSGLGWLRRKIGLL
jgi:Ser/Thr protein kinase RdoA (MazF antagonist)